MNVIKQFFLDLQMKLRLILHGTKTRLAEEQGDTNFISIAIILIVVISIAVVFIGFGNTISQKFSAAITIILNALP